MSTSKWYSKDTIAVVTGSNKGIGLEIVRQLVKEGLTVVLTARTEEKGLAAAQALKRQGLNVHVYALDVLSTDSVCELASWLKQQFNGVDILINNAAICDFEPNCEASFLEEVIETNYEGVKRVTRGFLPIMKASPSGSRIINISSRLGQILWLRDVPLQDKVSNLEDLTEEKVDAFVAEFLGDLKAGVLEEKGWPTSKFPAYCTSKVALNAYTRVLARSMENRPEGHKVYVNCVHPGFVKTDMNNNTGIFTPEQGAETAVWLALLPPECPNGQFFYEKKPLEF